MSDRREEAARSPGAANSGTPPSPAADRERIILLECRLEQMRSALGAAREEADSARTKLAESCAREADHARRFGEIHAELADARAEVAALHRRLERSEALKSEIEGYLFEAGAQADTDELARLRRRVLVEDQRALVNDRTLARLRWRVEDLAATRETLLTRVAEWQQLIRKEGPDAADLSEFLAELRREILELEHRNVTSDAREMVLRERLAMAGIDPDDDSGAHTRQGADRPQPPAPGPEPDAAEERVTADRAGAAESPTAVATAARAEAAEAAEVGSDTAGEAEVELARPSIAALPAEAGAALVEARGKSTAQEDRPQREPSTSSAERDSPDEEPEPSTDAAVPDSSAAAAEPTTRPTPAARDHGGDPVETERPEAPGAPDDDVGPTAVAPGQTTESEAPKATEPGRSTEPVAAVEPESPARPAPIPPARPAPRTPEPIQPPSRTDTLIADLMETATSARRADLLLQLGRSGDERAHNMIRPWTESLEASVRAAAYEALGRLLERAPDRLEPHLRTGLSDPDPRVRRRVALAAATARGLTPRRLLEPLKEDPDPQVRRVVREVLRQAPRAGQERESRPEEAAAVDAEEPHAPASGHESNGYSPSVSNRSLRAR